MRSLLMFAAGMIAGVLLMQPGAAQQATAERLTLNHVSLSVKNFDEAVNFYTKTMGFREAFTFREPDGKPSLTYLQISRDTFLELQPATAERPAGMAHIGLESTDVRATAKRLQQRGVKVPDPTVSQRSGAVLTTGSDGEGLRFELLEFGPASVQRKAMNAWK